MRHYRDSNCCSKVFYNYATHFVTMINLNKGEFKENMLESMELVDNETEIMTAKFEKKIDSEYAKWQK